MTKAVPVNSSVAGSRSFSPNFSRNCATKIWSPAPASPAITSAGSPGAMRIRKKLRTTRARRTITAFTSRWAMNDIMRCRSGWRQTMRRRSFVPAPPIHVKQLFLDPGVAETVVDADPGRDQVFHVAAGDGRKPQFEQPGHRHVLDQHLLRLGVDFLAGGVREGHRAVGQQLVDFRIGVAFDVVERVALDDLAGEI